jgi:hypothetical protein
MAFLETGAFVGLVPGETVVVVGGVAASHGDVSLPLIALTASLGAWLGHHGALKAKFHAPTSSTRLGVVGLHIVAGRAG